MEMNEGQKFNLETKLINFWPNATKGKWSEELKVKHAMTHTGELGMELYLNIDKWPKYVKHKPGSRFHYGTGIDVVGEVTDIKNRTQNVEFSFVPA